MAEKTDAQKAADALAEAAVALTERKAADEAKAK